MNFIDLFNFSQYFNREGDGSKAKVGHVNAVIEELNNLQDTVDNLPAPTLNITTDSTLSGAGTIGDPLRVTRPQNYKVYTALISQSGTNNPTIFKVLENTFINPITFTRGTTGRIDVQCLDIGGTGAGSTQNTVVIMGSTNGFIRTSNFYGGYGTIYTYNTSGVLADSIITQVLIEIRVY